MRKTVDPYIIIFDNEPRSRSSVTPIAVAAGIIAIGLIIAALIQVRVPLLWPLGTTALSVWLLRWGWLRGRTARPEAPPVPARRRDVPSVSPSRWDRPDDARIGDTDRDEVVAIVSECHAKGYLDPVETDERLSVVTAARRLGDLRAALADLPSGGELR